MKYQKSFSTIRGILGLSIQDFAKMTDLSKSFISRIENGQRQPSQESIEQAARNLDIPLKFFQLLALESDDEDYANAREIGEYLLRLLKRNYSINE